MSNIARREEKRVSDTQAFTQKILQEEGCKESKLTFNRFVIALCILANCLLAWLHYAVRGFNAAVWTWFWTFTQRVIWVWHKDTFIVNTIPFHAGIRALTFPLGYTAVITNIIATCSIIDITVKVIKARIISEAILIRGAAILKDKNDTM